MAAGENAGPSTSLRYGRDVNSVETGIDATEQSWTPQQNCHPDRSVAEWRDLQCALRLSRILPRMRPRIPSGLSL